MSGADVGRARERRPLRRGVALERTGGDRELLEELIGVFLHEIPGLDAGRCERRLERGDAAEVQRIAHTIKGAVDSCGASRAYDAAMLLERMGRDGELGGAPAALAALERHRSRALEPALRPDAVGRATPPAAAQGRRPDGGRPGRRRFAGRPHARGRAAQEGPGLTPVFAANGREALAAIASASRPTSCSPICRCPRWTASSWSRPSAATSPALPVILMTAHGSEEIAVAGAAQGAASYVAKRNLAAELVDTVLSVLEIARADRGQQHILSCLTQTESRYELDNDIASIAAADRPAGGQPEPHAAVRRDRLDARRRSPCARRW